MSNRPGRLDKYRWVACCACCGVQLTNEEYEENRWFCHGCRERHHLGEEASSWPEWARFLASDENEERHRRALGLDCRSLRRAGGMYVIDRELLQARDAAWDEDEGSLSDYDRVVYGEANGDVA